MPATELELSVFEASCGSEAILCSSTPSNLISVTPFTTYYVRVHSYLSSLTGTFNICIETVSPEIATINGSISGWNSNCTSRNVKVSLYNPTTLITSIFITPLTTSGTFVVNGIDIYAGTYHILVKVQGALTVLSEDVVLNGGANSLSTGPVVLGDLNNSNGINILDLSIFSASFATTAGSSGHNFLADFNCDGVANIFDVSILGAGFNQVGDDIYIPTKPEY
ncbi:hypothetical protein G3O08_14900 [Cryomorpha ignava]|uniref:Dockerin domain-containing protein n=1 Tax=Cryomorpha ignava TaxID=101383 RepID=A0A7K3WSW8_9FLAO|nr:dockerin type I domain-containing protein [Cryomorpha ignava]NEN24790.1 hypothetical protein [Cryomorpha ignava]